MKLAYSNWHKELVHDDSIRSELNSITGGELEFSNTPYIKHRNQNFERDDYRPNNGGRWQQNFGGRSNNNRSQGGQRSGGNNGGRPNNNRNTQQGQGGQRSGGNNGGRPDSRGGQFKKRY